MKPRRTRYVVAAAVCAAAVVTVVGLGVVLADNVVYFRTVSEAVGSNDDGRFRVGGDVVPDTLVDTGDGISFELTDGSSSITVVHRGDEPGILRDGVARGEPVPLVVEGHLGDDRVFESDRIMVRHGNEYEPAEDEFTRSSPPAP